MGEILEVGTKWLLDMPSTEETQVEMDVGENDLTHPEQAPDSASDTDDPRVTFSGPKDEAAGSV